MLASQISEFDSREQAIEAAMQDDDVQTLLAYVAKIEPDLLDKHNLWDLLVDRDAFNRRISISRTDADGSIRISCG